MTASTNTERLKALMLKYKVDAREVAAILGRSYKTVRTWRTVNGPAIPDPLLKLLELELVNRQYQPELQLEQESQE